MKKLILANSKFRYLEKSFREWLDILGYSSTTVYNLPNQIREFLAYLEQQEVGDIDQLKPVHIEEYYSLLKERTNERRGGGLSNAHLNKHIQALRKFVEYLRKVGRFDLPEVRLKTESTESKLVYLTEDEVRQLITTTYEIPMKSMNASDSVLEAIRVRDRAMLAVFYGCGLRRNEGVNLDVGDINFDRAVLHVRQGKNYKERMIPISKQNLKFLSDYVFDHRGTLLRDNKSDALFLTSTTCKRMHGQSLNQRVKLLLQYTGDLDLSEKEISLHTLRHSIATHLLTAGMKLESISRFLGHSSLESTQIYTHLIQESEDEI